jgi:hypothetical protein
MMEKQFITLTRALDTVHLCCSENGDQTVQVFFGKTIIRSPYFNHIEKKELMGNSFVSMLVNLFNNSERKIVGIWGLAYVLPLLVAGVARIPLQDSSVGQLISYPYATCAVVLPFSMVFWGPFLVPFMLGPSLEQGYWTVPITIPASIVFLVSFLFYPVASYFLLRRYRAAWILSFSSALATICLDAFAISNIPQSAVVWLFGIAINSLILYLLYSCRTEFFIDMT